MKFEFEKTIRPFWKIPLSSSLKNVVSMNFKLFLYTNKILNSSRFDFDLLSWLVAFGFCSVSFLTTWQPPRVKNFFVVVLFQLHLEQNVSWVENYSKCQGKWAVAWWFSIERSVSVCLSVCPFRPPAHDLSSRTRGLTHATPKQLQHK